MEIRKYDKSDLEQIIELFYNTITNVNCKDYNQAQLYQNESYTFFNVTKNIGGEYMSTRDDMVLEVQVWLIETYGEEIIEAMDFLL